jgi:hypothetical protein
MLPKTTYPLDSRNANTKVEILEMFQMSMAYLSHRLYITNLPSNPMLTLIKHLIVLRRAGMNCDVK